jgi:hypothetical protein
LGSFITMDTRRKPKWGQGRGSSGALDFKVHWPSELPASLLNCEAKNCLETRLACEGWEVDVLVRTGGKRKGGKYYMYVDVRKHPEVHVLPNLSDAVNAGFAWSERPSEDVK